MNKIKATMLLALLLLTIFAVFFSNTLIIPSAKASTGNILIESTSQPSHASEVHSGQNVSLYFGKVTLSGSQFYLVWSLNGFSSILPDDFEFSPVFNVTDLHGSQKLLNGIFIGNNWITIPTPTIVAGGHYYIKCFDGTKTSVSVTDNYINLLPGLEVVPFNRGPGGVSISLNGTGFYSNSTVNLTYYDPIAAANKTLKTVSADAQGYFSYNTTALDLRRTLPAGEYPISFDVIKFFGNDTKSGYQAEADYFEGKGGLLQVDGAYSLSGYMFGNNTIFAGIHLVQVPVKDGLIIAGNYFHPPAVTIYFDGVNIGTMTTNSSGFFNTTVTVPKVTPITSHSIILIEASINQTTTTTTTTMPTTTTTETSTLPTTTTTTTSVTTTATTTTKTTTTTKPTTTFTSTTTSSPSTTTQTSSTTFTSTTIITTTSQTTSSYPTTSTSYTHSPMSDILILAFFGLLLVLVLLVTAIISLKYRREGKDRTI